MKGKQEKKVSTYNFVSPYQLSYDFKDDFNDTLITLTGALGGDKNKPKCAKAPTSNRAFNGMKIYNIHLTF